jgi:hypothetical protein
VANRLYDFGRESFATKQVDWVGDTIKLALVSTAYTPNTATHQYLSDLGANTLGTDQTLAGKSATAGVCKASAVTWSGTPGTGTVGYLVAYKSTGVAGTSILVALLDTGAVNGGASGAISLALNGGTVTFTPDGTLGLFKL